MFASTLFTGEWLDDRLMKNQARITEKISSLATTLKCFSEVSVVFWKTFNVPSIRKNDKKIELFILVTLF